MPHWVAGAVGASWVSGADYAGLSLDTARQHYGTTVEPDTAIRMQRDRVATAGRWGLAAGAELTAQTSHSRYRHQELDGDGAVGTTFASQGSEGRVQLRQATTGSAASSG